MEVDESRAAEGHGEKMSRLLRAPAFVRGLGNGGLMAPTEPDEVLFTVVGDKATIAKTVRIEDLGLTEPYHLERWVMQYPETLGAGVLIVASQYDKWVSPGGAESKDRLDLLGLGRDGRLVVAELKRGRSPDTVELQAVKYAAMASRFTLEKLADLHARLLERTAGDKLTSEEALEKLQAHVAADVELAVDLFTSPRIVLLAESYPDTTTTSAVWLAEQGVDITLRRYAAYETAGGETIVSVSQVYPLADVGNWLLGPGKPSVPAKTSEQLPDVPWSIDDFTKLIQLKFPVPIEALTACAEAPNEWVPLNMIYDRAAVAPPSGRGQLAGFGFSVRTTFGRSNPPWQAQWRAGGENCNYYRVDTETADEWLAAVAAASQTEGKAAAVDGNPPDSSLSSSSANS